MLRGAHMACLGVYVAARARALEGLLRLVGWEPLPPSALQLQSAEQLSKTMQGCVYVCGGGGGGDLMSRARGM